MKDPNYLARKPSFFEKRRIKHSIEYLSSTLHRPPFPTYAFSPALYWLSLDNESFPMEINASVLEKVISDISTQLSLSETIKGYKIIYHNSEYPWEAFPDTRHVSIIDGQIILSISTWLNGEHSIPSIAGCHEILFLLIYEMSKLYLEKNNINDLSDYLIHIAFIFLGFGNYVLGPPGWHFVYDIKTKNVEKRIVGFNDWSDTNTIRQLCRN